SGLVVEHGRRAWRIDDPGDEVVDGRDPGAAGATVVVGPPHATRREVDQARRAARRIDKRGGAQALAAGIILEAGFRTAQLEGAPGAVSRRDAVLAAAEVLGVDGLDRLGEAGGPLVALFGPRATKKVGHRALGALATGNFSALRLA